LDRPRNASQTRELSFKACSQILRPSSLISLALDAGANQAGISKGGLLYQFLNKEALIEALF